MNDTVVVNAVATADIHSPKYLPLFKRALENLNEEVDLFLLAGDLVEKNNYQALKEVVSLIKSKLGNIPLIACFGNEEYRGFEEKYKSLYKEIIWIDDYYYITEIKGLKIGIIGSRGALDRPTSWQRRNMPWIINYYRELPRKLEELAKKIKDKTDVLILLIHYGVTYKNLLGEPRTIWPYLASKRVEEIIIKGYFDIVIHGHAHNAVIEKTTINSTEIYNVSLPGRKKLVKLKISKKAIKGEGILKWIK